MKNDYVVQGDVTAIKVESKYGIFWILIDTKNLEIMPEGAIFVHKDPSGFYAQYRDGRKVEILHRLIMGFPEGLEIDHWNHDTLDERRENLRAVTKQVNAFNQCAKGYCWREDVQKWRARIMLDGKRINLGCFQHEQDAEYRYLLAKEIIHDYLFSWKIQGNIQMSAN